MWLVIEFVAAAMKDYQFSVIALWFIVDAGGDFIEIRGGRTDDGCETR
jgi:hypothetical protein